MFKVKKLSVIALITLYTAAYYLCIILGSSNHFYLTFISNVLQIIPPIVVFTLLIIKLSKDKLYRNSFWLFISIGCGCYLASQLIWSYYELILGISNPIIWPINILWAVTALSNISALSIKILERRDIVWTKLLLLDTLIIVCVSAAILWFYIMQPSYMLIFNMNISSWLILLIYPIVNLISLSAALSLYFSLKPQDKEKASLHPICLSFLFMFIANSVFSYMLIAGSYYTGSIIDPLWSLNIMLIGYAVIEYKYSEAKDQYSEIQDGSLSDPSRFFIVPPLISTVLIFAFMLFIQGKVVWLCLALTILLITLRHAMTIKHNKALILKLSHITNTLEGKVSERTKELYNIAFYDQLTGLPNRRLFESNLKKSVFIAYQRHTSLALMFLDLDRFKTINDSFGHSVGDLMLREIAERIKLCLMDNCILSRQGGDEFAIIIENYGTKEDLVSIAQNILDHISRPVEIFGQSLHTSCSIGIALYSSSCEDPDTLMRYADAAMYYSKDSGKNTFQFYTEELNRCISKKLELETELAKALDNQELSIYYQPQINIQSGSIIGAEALLRWKHPVLGLISPEDFIPIAEESGMIKEIGFWVLKTACYQAKQWHREGFINLKLGVNISPQQIQQENFVSMIAEVLKETGLEPQYLDLEITESASFQNEAEVIMKLKELKKIGVQISIDDFGTGYSSLSYLNKLPVDTLKIAQQFVKYIKSDSSNKAIITSIIAVAQSLKLKIVAEGVEEQYQYNFLKAQNCYNMQGYIFSKPVPLAEFIAIMKGDIIPEGIKLNA